MESVYLSGGRWGVNQGYEAVRTAQAIINLALMTGNIGKPGTGANSITGQCNAMGSRSFSNTSVFFGGGILQIQQEENGFRKFSAYRMRCWPRSRQQPIIRSLKGLMRDGSKVCGFYVQIRGTAGRITRLLRVLQRNWNCLLFRIFMIRLKVRKIVPL